jgi:hypothetical protein
VLLSIPNTHFANLPNILRIIRGAGKPNELVEQVYRLAEAMHEYQSAAGSLPDPAIYAHALLLDTRDDILSRCSAEERARECAKQMILRGALQVVASRMVHQLTIERTGDTEMYNGIRELERIREESRRRTPAEVRAASPSKKRTGRKPKAEKIIVL